MSAALAAATGPPPQPKIEDLLRGLDRASFLYLDTAMKFACKEKIVEWGPGLRQRMHNFDYLFVYDKVKGFQDYRTQGGKEQGVQVSPTQQGVGLFLERSYMWVLIFNRTRFPHYRYSILEWDIAQGINTVRVRFEPIPPYKDGINDWDGTAWIDPTTYQIVKVEAMKSRDLEEKQRMEKETNELLSSSGEGPAHSYRIEQASTEFSVVKNGIRFPSTTEIVSTLYYLPKHSRDHKPEVANEAHVKQTYSHYRFYGVRTSEEVRQVLHPSKKPEESPR